MNANPTTLLKKQPKALYLLNFVSMWECFSYYGMRVLLVLYMTQVLEMGDKKAFALYALYTTLVEFGGVIGGIFADKVLGLKRAIILGGWTIAFGHIALAIPDSQVGFYLGLALIIAGTSFFRTNVAAFLGEFYQENDPRRDAAYTIYYTGINIGSFLATLLCGLVSDLYGWHAGFGLAAVGMLAGNLALLAGSKVLKREGAPLPPPEDFKISLRKILKGTAALALGTPLCAVALYFYDQAAPYFGLMTLGFLYYAYKQFKVCSREENRKLRMLALYLGFLILYYACEEQLGSTLILFSERHVERGTFYGIIPAASLIMFNPLTILVAGPLLTKQLNKVSFSPLSKIAIGFLLLGGAFILLWIGCFFPSKDETISLSFAMMSIVLIALGELFIGPTVYSAASEASPKGLSGLTMSLVTLGFSFSNFLSGTISQTMAIEEETLSLKTYQEGFYLIGLASLAVAIFAFILNKKRKALTT